MHVHFESYEAEHGNKHSPYKLFTSIAFVPVAHFSMYKNIYFSGLKSTTNKQNKRNREKNSGTSTDKTYAPIKQMIFIKTRTQQHLMS